MEIPLVREEGSSRVLHWLVNISFIAFLLSVGAAFGSLWMAQYLGDEMQARFECVEK